MGEMEFGRWTYCSATENDDAGDKANNPLVPNERGHENVEEGPEEDVLQKTEVRGERTPNPGEVALMEHNQQLGWS